MQPEFLLKQETQSEKETEDCVAGVVARRSENLVVSGISVEISAQSRTDGKLLLYYPNENVADGASEFASHGFFDLYDAPPWDTWIHFSNGALLSWVPAVLAPLVELGFDVNIVDCIQWANQRILLELLGRVQHTF